MWDGGTQNSGPKGIALSREVGYNSVNSFLPAFGKTRAGSFVVAISIALKYNSFPYSVRE
jgi:hypothetical protein